MLRENRSVMDKLAEYLIEKETITGKEFMQIFRREKGIPEPEEKKVIPMPGPVAGTQEPDAIPREPEAVPRKPDTMPQEPDGLPQEADATLSVDPGDVTQDPQEPVRESGGGTAGTVRDAAQEPDSEEGETAEQDDRPAGRFSGGRIE